MEPQALSSALGRWALSVAHQGVPTELCRSCRRNSDTRWLLARWVPEISSGWSDQDFRGAAPCDELAIEVVILRHEIAVLRRQVARPVLQTSDRALFAGLSRLLDRRRWERFFVQPGTLLRWHRDLVRRRWTEPHRPGRPGIPDGTVAIILRSAGEDPTWGYCRIPGELARLGVLLAHRVPGRSFVGTTSIPR